MWYKERMAPEGIQVYNPAFDVTDHDLITAIVTEYGVVPTACIHQKIFSVHMQGKARIITFGHHGMSRAQHNKFCFMFHPVFPFAFILYVP